jgi:hypothetical protein
MVVKSDNTHNSLEAPFRLPPSPGAFVFVNLSKTMCACVRSSGCACVRVCVCTATKPFRGARVSGVRSREKKIQETRPRLSAATCARMHRPATTTHRQATIITVASHDLTTATRVPDTATLRPTTVRAPITRCPQAHQTYVGGCAAGVRSCADASAGAAALAGKTWPTPPAAPPEARTAPCWIYLQRE